MPDTDVHVAPLTDDQIDEIARTVAEILHNGPMSSEVIERRFTSNATSVMEAIDQQTGRPRMLASPILTVRHTVTATHSQIPVPGVRGDASGLVAEFYHQMEHGPVSLKSVLANSHMGTQKLLLKSVVAHYWLIKNGESSESL